MKVTWKVAFLMYGAVAQLALLRAMTHFLFSSAASASLSRSVLVNSCAAIGGIATSALQLSVVKDMFHANGLRTREILACGGLCGSLASAVTYEVLIFALSIGISSPMDHSEGTVYSMMRFGLTLISLHTYSLLDFIPLAGLGFVSGVIATWVLLRLWRTNLLATG